MEMTQSSGRNSMPPGKNVHTMPSLDNWLAQRIEERKASNLYRVLRTMEGAPHTEMKVDSKRQIVFSSNNYLGLANDRRLKSQARKALEEFGVGSSGSRLTTGNTIWHEKLERKIASFKETEAALLFSSGYLANIGVLSSIPEKGDVILSDELNHASIIDGCRLSKAKTVIYQHADMDDLQQKLLHTSGYRRRFIVTDGVFSMDGTIAPLDQIQLLANKHQAYIVVDDAHATGVIGKDGRGTSDYFQVQPDIIIGTLSKAIGTEGGFVAGSHKLIDFLLNHARSFIFQTAMPASSCAASIVAFEQIEKRRVERQQLFKHIKKVRDRLNGMGYITRGDETPIIPIIIGDEKATMFAKMLQDKGIYAPAIRPPTVPLGESRIRLTVTAEHTPKDVDTLLDSFQFIGKELNIIQ